MGGFKFSIWKITLALLLKLPFANLPSELKSSRHWDAVFLEAQNRILDRGMGRYRRKFNVSADAYSEECLIAIGRYQKSTFKAGTTGFLLLVLGCIQVSLLLQFAAR